MPEIEKEQRDASSARVPTVPVGRALVFVRYSEEKAVVLHPEDFRRLSALDRDIEEIASRGSALSDLALKAHALEDQSTGPLEDADEIRALLGL